MSDMQQAPGWWQASDKKWYPPESHPIYSPPPPPPSLLPTAQTPPGQPHYAQAAAQAREEVKNPIWKRWWFIGSLLLVVIVVIANLANSTEGDTPGATGDNPTVAPGATVAPGLPTVTPTAAPVVPEAPAKVTPLPPGANPALAVAGIETLPAGEPGQLSIVAQGTVLERSGSLPVVVRNLTDKPVARLEVTGTARDASGALVGSGSDQGLNPFVVGPGEIAIGYVYFGMDELPSGATFELTVTGTALDDVFIGGLDLVVAEHNRTADSIVVVLRNDTDKEASGPIGLILMCFDEAGMPTDTHRTYAEQNVAPPGATVSATFSFYGDPPCERYILGGSGYDF